jgi:hypothetical protein
MIRRAVILCVLLCGTVNAEVSTTTYRETLHCDGSNTEFTYTWNGANGSDIAVYLRDTTTNIETLLATTSYSVSATNNDYSSGGVVTTTLPYAAVYDLVVVRVTPNTQTVQLPQSRTIERALDRLIRMIQEVVGSVSDRCLKIPITDDPNLGTELPSAGTAGYVYRGSNGHFSLANPVSTDANMTKTWQEVVAADANDTQRQTAREDIEAERAFQFNVKDYGAVGNGTTDDTAAFNRTLDAQAATGRGYVYAPGGTYKMIPTASSYGSFALWFHNHNRLIGDGNDTILKVYGPGNIIGVDRSDPGNHDGMVIARLQIDGNYTAYSESTGSTDANDNGILVENCNQFKIHDVYIHHVYGYGIFLRNGTHDCWITNSLALHCGNGTRSADGIYITGRCSRIFVSNNRTWYGSRHGIMVNNEGPSSLGNLEDVWVESNNSQYNGISGVSVYDGVNYCTSGDGLTQNIHVRHNTANNNGTAGAGWRGGIQVANVMAFVAGHYRTHLQNIEIADNIVGDNELTGILIRAQSSGAIHYVSIKENNIYGSATGIQLVTNGDPNCNLDHTTISGNNLHGNMTDLAFTGDVATNLGSNYHLDTTGPDLGFDPNTHAANFVGDVNVPTGSKVTVNGVSVGDTNSVTVTLDPNSLALDTNDILTVAFPDTALGDEIVAIAPYDMQGIMCYAYVKSAGICKVQLFKPGAGTVNLASGSWKIVQRKH